MTIEGGVPKMSVEAKVNEIIAQQLDVKIEEIKPWLFDENEKVRNFSANYIKGRENEANSERRRAEEDIELRKHAYGVREEKADEEDGASEKQESATKDGGEEE